MLGQERQAGQLLFISRAPGAVPSASVTVPAIYPSARPSIRPSIHACMHQLFCESQQLAGRGSPRHTGGSAPGPHGSGWKPASPRPAFAKLTPPSLRSSRPGVRARGLPPWSPRPRGPAGRQRSFILPSLGYAWGCSFSRVCRGDIFGRPGCLAGEIHQPASSARQPDPRFNLPVCGFPIHVFIYICVRRDCFCLPLPANKSLRRSVASASSLVWYPVWKLSWGLW